MRECPNCGHDQYDCRSYGCEEPVSHTPSHRFINNGIDRCSAWMPGGRFPYCGQRARNAIHTEPHPDDCPACLDERGAELEAQDRAMQARYGGRILRILLAHPKYADHTPQLLALAHDLAVE